MLDAYEAEQEVSDTGDDLIAPLALDVEAEGAGSEEDDEQEEEDLDLA